MFHWIPRQARDDKEILKYMTEYLSEINYEKLVEKSLKHVIKESLKIAASQGLPGEHHLYITFKTNHPKTKISDYLKSQYPAEMTIVLQHQFYDLDAREDGFSVSLSFSGIPQKLDISYDSVSYFADPHAKFGLSFSVDGETENDDITFEKGVDLEPKKAAPAEVFDISAFRKK